VPHLEVDVGDGLAGIDVDDLVVEHNVDTLLVLDDVAADVLAGDVVGTLGDLGGEDARVLRAEEGGGVGVCGVAEVGLVVAGGKDGGEVALLDVDLQSSVS
jgi:hypothetical protein